VPDFVPMIAPDATLTAVAGRSLSTLLRAGFRPAPADLKVCSYDVPRYCHDDVRSGLVSWRPTASRRGTKTLVLIAFWRRITG
jgi:hypothetical protein